MKATRVLDVIVAAFILNVVFQSPQTLHSSNSYPASNWFRSSNATITPQPMVAGVTIRPFLYSQDGAPYTWLLEIGPLALALLRVVWLLFSTVAPLLQRSSVADKLKELEDSLVTERAKNKRLSGLLADETSQSQKNMEEAVAAASKAAREADLYAEAEKEIYQLRNQVKVLESENQALQKELVHQTEDHNREQAALSAQLQVYVEHNRNLARRDAESMQALMHEKGLTGEWLSEKRTLQDKIVTMNGELDQLVDALDAKEEALVQALDEIKRQREELLACNSELERAKSQLDSKRVWQEMMQEQLSKFTEDNNEYRGKLTELTERYNQLKVQHTTTESHRVELAAEVDRLSSINDRLVTDVPKTAQKFETLFSSYTKYYEELNKLIEEKTCAVAARDAELADVKRLLETAKAEVEKLQSEAALRDEQIAALELKGSVFKRPKS